MPARGKPEAGIAKALLGYAAVRAVALRGLGAERGPFPTEEYFTFFSDGEERLARAERNWNAALHVVRRPNPAIAPLSEARTDLVRRISRVRLGVLVATMRHANPRGNPLVVTFDEAVAWWMEALRGDETLVALALSRDPTGVPPDRDPSYFENPAFAADLEGEVKRRVAAVPSHAKKLRGAIQSLGERQ